MPRMKDSPLWLRLYLGITGVLALMNITVVGNLQGDTPVSRTGLVLTFAFATLSVFNALMLFFAAWQAPRLLAKGPKFIRFAIFFRFVLLVVERIGPAAHGDYMSISLILVWSGMSFYMAKVTDRLAEQAKAGI